MSERRAVHVLVGLIGGEDGRWLVNQRRAGTHMAGFWEFPGGKLAAGEQPFEALSRELDEELGIEVLEAEPLLTLVHDYPDNRVWLDVWRVLRYGGDVEPREGQALRWVDVEDLAGLPLLEADEPIIDRLRALRADAER